MKTEVRQSKPGWERAFAIPASGLVFASGGAMIGSVAGPAGGMAGAAVGALAGIAVEAFSQSRKEKRR